MVAHEQGLVMPGMVIAAGDSHTTTYGAFGALGFGIGTSEIEHLLATQTLVYRKLKTMRVSVQESYLSPVPQKILFLNCLNVLALMARPDMPLNLWVRPSAR